MLVNGTATMRWLADGPTGRRSPAPPLASASEKSNWKVRSSTASPLLSTWIS
jgi:hypothetical protein